MSEAKANGNAPAAEAMLAALTASRARAMAAADELRQRLQREIHDGVQQRLVHASMALKSARGALEADSAVLDLVDETLANLEQASRDLREVVQHILPRSLTSGGLRIGLQSLADEVAVPVAVLVDTPRLAAELETAVYLATVDAVSHAVTEAGAERVSLSVELAHDVLVLDVEHDGQAPAARAVHVLRAADRFEALGGSFSADRRPDGRFRLRAELPDVSDRVSSAPFYPKRDVSGGLGGGVIADRA